MARHPRNQLKKRSPAMQGALITKNFHGLFTYGMILYQNGSLHEAKEVFDRVLEIQPGSFDTLKMLGVIYCQAGKPQEGLEFINRAIAIKSDSAEAYAFRGDVLYGLKQFNAAIENYGKAISINPSFAALYFKRGNLLQEMTQYEAAIVSYEKAISISPEYAEAYNNRGIALKNLRQIDDALSSYDKAISINPNYAEALSNRGNLLHVLKQYEAAILSLSRAININPSYPEAYYNKGNVLQEMHQHESAIANYDKAISIRPNYAAAYLNRGNVLKNLKRHEEAITSYDKAISINPNYAEAYNNRAALLLKVLIQPVAAVIDFSKAISINPYYPEAYSNRGIALKDLYQYKFALDNYDKAISINPNYASAHQNRSIVLAYLSDYRGVIAHNNIALAQAPESSAIWEGRLYTWIYHPDLSTNEIVAEHIRWGERFPMPAEDKFINHQRSVHRRLRVGYVSPDFRGHTCRFYFDPLFSQHDHTKFEFFAYSNVAIEDEHTQRFKTYFDTWRNIYGVSDQNVAEMVQCDQIDILVDACGHMLDTRLEVFALKPAPIQVTWLGAAWTTGLKQIDYALFDPYMGPLGTQASETIVQLPRTWAAFRPSEKALKTAVASLPALKNGHITFGYSGRSERLNYKVFHAWGKLLQRLPQARLILDFKAFSDPPTQAYFQKFMSEHGIDVERVTLRNSANIFEGLGEIDIVLDSFPHSGGTMLFDALWMGVPTVTLASRPPVGRIGTSLMTNLGLPEWVAQDEEGYINKAVEFASDFDRLAELRAGMRERMSASPVMDEKGFARDVENAYKVMWQDWCGKVDT